MSGMASAALTIPGSVAPFASCSSDASRRMCEISASSATISPGTRMPGLAAGGIRKRYGPTCSSFIGLGARGSVRRTRPAIRPGDADERHDHAGQARELRDAELSHPEAVETERLDREASDRVEPDIGEEERARMLAQPRPQPGDQHHEDGEVPHRLIEKRRVEVLELAEPGRPVRGRDVELPGQVRRPPEGLLVEEVAPTSDGLADCDAGRGHVEAPQHGQAPSPGQERADQRPDDEAAVDGEPTFPDGDDLRRVLPVVIPVEDHLVEPRAHQPREDRPLRGADDVVGGELLAVWLAMDEPEAHDDRHRPYGG